MFSLFNSLQTTWDEGQPLTGSPKNSVMYLGWFYSIFRALAVIPDKENWKSTVEGKGGWIREKEGKDRRKEKQQREGESRTWVVKDEMLLEHFIFKDPNIYAFLNILRANISYSLSMKKQGKHILSHLLPKTSNSILLLA